jgi:hypothetical protein
MKAISLWQPWATLWGLGLKRFETRSWGTPHRGELAIHASKNETMVPLMFQEHFRQALKAAGFGKRSALAFGAVVAVGELIGCHLITEAFVEEFVDLTEEEFGDFTPGRYAWEIINPRMVGPYPCRGQQRLWNWTQMEQDWDGVT